MKTQIFKEKINQWLPPRTKQQTLCDNTKYQSHVYHKTAMIQLTFKTREETKALKTICSILHYFIHHSQNTCH